MNDMTESQLAARVTAEQAEQVLAALKHQQRAYLGVNGSDPKIVEDWDFLDTGPYAVAIVWEDGPYEWAHVFPYGGVDEEATELLQEFAPGEVVGSEDVSGQLPEGVHTEAITSWAIAVYQEVQS